MMNGKSISVSKSYTAYSKADEKKIEHQLLKEKYHFLKEEGYYLYYKDYTGKTACIYRKYKGISP